MNIRFSTLVLACIILLPVKAFAAEPLKVAPVTITDEKAVFATIESTNVVPARARISGTVVDLAVDDGDHVEAGQVLAIVGDDKIAFQISALDSRIAAADAEVSRAKTDLDRLKVLVPKGAASESALDQAQRDYNVAISAQKAVSAERDVVKKQLSEGQVLAPVSGRILKVPVTAGTVIMPGETLAIVAEENYILRLEVPERHARFMKVGEPVRLDKTEMAESAAQNGKITLIYPQIENGRVIADASAEGLGNYFVGQRVRVWISGGDRTGIIVPPEYLTMRFGVDYARVKQQETGETIEVPVQRGQSTKDGIEILSGIKSGDILVQP
ncbi:MAG: efflux RND transporter periplasmic adaptor subunit [Alphaproteobacteria bacterium]|nr:efflux RND transporter periplasmic adaptor subunit [Alphaproteobacteria bacterium]